MKPKSLILIFAAIIISNFTPFNTSYSQTSGPMASTVYSLAFSGTNILAGTESGIFKSSDNGKTWDQTTLWNQIARYLCTNGQTLIASVPFVRLYRSTNKGVKWEELKKDKGIWYSSMTSIDTIIFAGTNKGLYSSTDNGISWLQTSFNGEVNSITSYNSTIYVNGRQEGHDKNGIYTSSNYGRDWEGVFNSELRINTFAVSGSDVYTSTEESFSIPNKLFRSTDSGQNWKELDFKQRCLSLVVAGSYIYAGSSNGIFVSSDKGETWRNSLSDKSIFSIIANDSLVFCGTEKYGVYVSTNKGMNWLQTSLINLEIKPKKFEENQLLGYWEDYVIPPAGEGSLITIIFTADSFYYYNRRYSDVWEGPCSKYFGFEYASGEYSIENNYILLTGYWTDYTYKNILTEAPCNSGKFEFEYKYKYYSNHMLHLKTTEPYKLPNTGVKAELYLYKK